MDIKFQENAMCLVPGSYYYAGTRNIARSKIAHVFQPSHIENVLEPMANFFQKTCQQTDKLSIFDNFWSRTTGTSQ